MLRSISDPHPVEPTVSIGHRLGRAVDQGGCPDALSEVGARVRERAGRICPQGVVVNDLGDRHGLLEQTGGDDEAALPPASHAEHAVNGGLRAASARSTSRERMGSLCRLDAEPEVPRRPGGPLEVGQQCDLPVAVFVHVELGEGVELDKRLLREGHAPVPSG